MSTWLDPWAVYDGKGFQIVQSMFGLGTGGFDGHRPRPAATRSRSRTRATDFIFSAIGEELGLLGTVAVLAAILLFVGTGFRIAVQAERPFPKLFAAGLTTIIGVQTFVIIGGVIARDPAHRHHAAVHLLRRLVAHRQLRDPGAAAAHLRRQRRSSLRAPRDRDAVPA